LWLFLLLFVFTDFLNNEPKRAKEALALENPFSYLAETNWTIF